ncbi:MAG: hypothetical protein COA60_008410 [Robiginitomaculum sp.]|nr:hypothetical protein [Robiginitomaculum sp.]
MSFVNATMSDCGKNPVTFHGYKPVNGSLWYKGYSRTLIDRRAKQRYRHRYEKQDQQKE